MIVFTIGLPLVVAIILFFPQRNHLFFNLLTLVFTSLAAVEFRNILAQKDLVVSVPEAAILGAIGPASWILVISFGFNINIVPVAILLGASWMLVSHVFFFKKQLDSYISSAAAGFTVIIYPGLFTACMIRLSSLSSNPGIVILFFLLIVCLNDSLAWVAGILFGKNNRGLVAVSPNKSLAGFIGGQIFSLLAGIAAVLLFPDVFVPEVLSPLSAGIILGFGTGLAAIMGDLCESALKRSSGIKDSGSVILGRGGALDSIDSLAMAAPVYYLLCRLLFHL